MEKTPRVRASSLSVYVYAYRHPQALGLQVPPEASSKPGSTQDTLCLQGSTEEAHGPTRPGLDTGLLLQCSRSPFSPSHHPCCCLDRMTGAPVMPASEQRDHLGLKPLCIGPQQLLLGLAKGVHVSMWGDNTHKFSHTKTHPPSQLPGQPTGRPELEGG